MQFDFEIAEVFYQIARMLLITGGNEYRAAAYFKAALAIDGYGKRVAEVLEKKKLEALPGIGKGIASKTEQLLRTGSLPLYESLKSQVPEWILALSGVPGIGFRTLAALHKLGLSSPPKLTDPSEAERLRLKAAVTAKQWDLIKHTLSRRQTHVVQLAHADAIAEELIDWLVPKFAWRVEKTGALRRREEAVPKVDLLVGTDDLDSLRARIRGFRLARHLNSKKTDEWTLETSLGITGSFYFVHDQMAFALKWLVTTGDDKHLRALSEHARGSGIALEFADRAALESKSVLGLNLSSEEKIYKRLCLSWIPPELRQGRDEIDLARRGELPQLVNLSDVRADLHLHTRWSDGIGTIEDMAESAKSLGYEFLAITDHSVSLRIANGLGTERLIRQSDEIKKWNKAHSELRILSGLEVDILADGTLDLPDHVLSRLDWVVASVHSAMNLPEHEMMRRLERAILNPNVDAIGHPTGRLLGKPGHIFYHREPFAVDFDNLIVLCAKHHVGLEINCFPERMDLSSGLSTRAGKAGIRLHLGTDAHAPEHLRLMRFGVDLARRASLTKSALRNCQSLDEILAPRGGAKSTRSTASASLSKTKPTGAFGLIWDDRPRTFHRFFRRNPEITEGRYRVVGIDLTASKSRPTGWALLEGRHASTKLLRTDEELIGATLAEKPDVVSIDSPLSLPRGRCCARENCECQKYGIIRVCERILMTMRIGVFPCLLPSMKPLTLRGIALAKSFRDQGVDVIESYPGAAQDMLGISRKGKGIDLLLDGLNAFGIKLAAGKSVVHDELDAITSALVGYFWKAGQYLGLGIPEENDLIVPRIPKFREGANSAVIGLAGRPAAGKTTVGDYLAFKYGFRYTRYSLLLRQMYMETHQGSDLLDLQEYGLQVHHSLGPVKLTRQLVRTLTEGENWVIDGLRHMGDYETLRDHYGSRFYMVFVEASDAHRQRRLGYDPKRGSGAPRRDNHPVEEEVPLLSFRTTLRLENNASFKKLFEQVDRILGVR